MGNIAPVAGKKRVGGDFGGESTSLRVTVPAFSNAKNLNTLPDYPKINLSQLNEAYEFWILSEFHVSNSLSERGFEEVFGQLFPDPSAHFQELQNRFVAACPANETFVLFALLCDADMKNKLKFVVEMNRESRIQIRVESIQFLAFRILSALQLAFRIDIPPKEELYTYIELSVKQFIERGVVAMESQDRAGERSTSSPSHSPSHSPSRSAEKSLSFSDLWQWCQDVHSIFFFLESIQDMCALVTNRSPHSPKSLQHALRHSFFNTTRRSSNNGDLSALLFKWQRSNLLSFAWHERPAVWSMALKDMTSQAWLEDIVLVEGDICMLNALDHIMLSPKQSVVVVDRTQYTVGTHGAASTTPTHVHAPHGGRLSTSKKASPREGRSTVRAGMGERLHLLGILDGLAFLTHLLHSLPPSLFRSLLRKLDTSSQQVKGLSSEFSLAKEAKAAVRVQSLLHSLLLRHPSFILPSAEADSLAGGASPVPVPPTPASHDSLLPTSLPDGPRSTRRTTSKWASQPSRGSALSAAGTGPLSTSSSSTAAGTSRDKPLPTYTSSLWQETSQTIAHASVKAVYEEAGFRLYNRKYGKKLAFALDTPLYTALLLFAQGYRHVPVTLDPGHSYYNLVHTLDQAEMLATLLASHAVFFPQAEHTTVFASGLLRPPVLVQAKESLAVAWMLGILEHCDTVLVVDDARKVCGVLDLLASLREAWGRWRKTAYTPGSKAAAGACVAEDWTEWKAKYREGTYAFYCPQEAASPADYPASNQGGGFRSSIGTGTGERGTGTGTGRGRELTINTSLDESLPTGPLDLTVLLRAVHTSLSSLDTSFLETVHLEDHLAEPRQRTTQANPRGARHTRRNMLPPAQQLRLLGGGGGKAAGGVAPSDMTAAEQSAIAHAVAAVGGAVATASSSAGAGAGTAAGGSFSAMMAGAGRTRRSFAMQPAGGGEAGGYLGTDPPPSRGVLSPQTVEGGQASFSDPTVSFLAEGGSPGPVRRSFLSTSFAVPGSPGTEGAAGALTGLGSVSANVPDGKSSSSSRKRAAMRDQQAQLQAMAQHRMRLQAIRKKRRLEQWFAMVGVVTPEDSLLTALRFMANRSVSSVHVVSQNADPIGTLTFRDVCKYLIVEEAKMKLKLHQQYSQPSQSQKAHKPKVV